MNLFFFRFFGIHIGINDQSNRTLVAVKVRNFITDNHRTKFISRTANHVLFGKLFRDYNAVIHVPTAASHHRDTNRLRNRRCLKNIRRNHLLSVKRIKIRETHIGVLHKGRTVAYITPRDASARIHNGTFG